MKLEPYKRAEPQDVICRGGLETLMLLSPLPSLKTPTDLYLAQSTDLRGFSTGTAPLTKPQLLYIRRL